VTNSKWGKLYIITLNSVKTLARESTDLNVTDILDKIENDVIHGKYEESAPEYGIDVKAMLDLKNSPVKMLDDLADLRNFARQLCGKYKTAHEGSCEGCRWKR